jgi:predicted ATPase
MDKETKEILEIHDFLSIKHIKWECNKFNIITGDMAAGKSLCIKLIQFFEDIIPNLLVAPYGDFILYLKNSKNFYDYIIKTEFRTIFTFAASKNKELNPFRVTYTFSCNEEIFSVTITGTDSSNITMESHYLENLFSEWNISMQKKDSDSQGINTPDGFKEKKLTFYNDILKRFGGYFPIATTFVPASRAALAFSSNHTDHHLMEFKELVDFFPRFHNRKQEIQETVNAILKAKMKLENGALFLESDDGRKVHISRASSGQQEIVYVLWMLAKLGNFNYTYGKHHSVFIEEPSAHLFPMEQKQTIELIVRIFSYLKGNGNPVRFFITTHSPYVLNSLNNNLTKGALLDKYKDQEDRINESFDIPHLNADEVSALFINNDGTAGNMLDMDEKYMFADKIAEISIEIDKISAGLSQLKNDLYGERELTG